MNRIAWLSAVLALVVAAPGSVATAAQKPGGILDGYTNYKALADQVAALGKSKGVTVTSLGTTLGKRDVFVITVGRGEADKKPAVLIVGNVEPAHLVGSELAMRLARRLTADDETTGKLLDRFTFYIIPRPSPDASEAFFTRPYVERGGNLRPADDDNDGKTDEDGPDDLNRDGLITMMRVLDPAGEWMEHPTDKRIMIKADPKKQERGRYKLYTEGLDNDKDEKFNEDGPGGTNFNRNFTFNYPFFTAGAGPNQVSEVETRGVADFCFSHNNIAAVFCFAPQDNLDHPWKPGARGDGRDRTTVDEADAPLMDLVSEKYRKATGVKDAPPAAGDAGAFVPWAYYHYGRWSFGARAWWVPAEEKKSDEGKKEEKKDAPAAPPKGPGKRGPKDGGKGPPSGGGGEKKDDRSGEILNALRWFKEQKVDGFVAWKPVEHPDFPGKTVEVGGVKPFVLDNPPAKELDKLADGQFKFLGELAGLMPRVEIGEVKVEALGGGVFRVTATALNEGTLPTASAQGVRTREPLPLQWHLDLPKDAKLITGHAREQIGPLAGTGGRRETTWLVRTDAAELKLTIESPSVGSVTKTVPLTQK